jgi:hypothetical protein
MFVISPRLPDAGIWRDIFLTCIDRARMPGVMASSSSISRGVHAVIAPEVEVLTGAPALRTQALPLC